MIHMGKTIDLTGRIHGDFTVIEKTDKFFVSANGKKHAIWACKCNTCGAIEYVQARYIQKGQHKFCQACFDNRPDVKEQNEALMESINECLIQAGRAPKSYEEVVDFAHQYCHAVYARKPVGQVIDSFLAQ